jgi:glycosyltransferase involved in cell wall biosynthesis
VDSKLVSFTSSYIEKKSDYLLMQSKHKSNVYQKRGVDPNKTIVFPFLINDYQKNVWERRKKSKLMKIFYLGRFIELKGIDILLKAFYMVLKNNFNEMQLEIVLAGGTLEDLLKISSSVKETYNLFVNEKIEDSIKILGYLDEIEKSEIFNQIEIYVIPTKTNEGWGISLMEATQSGAICIATNVVAAAFEFIVEGENGFIIPANDEKELANAISKCIHLSPQQFESFSIKSRNLFEQYNSQEEVLRILESL